VKKTVLHKVSVYASNILSYQNLRACVEVSYLS